MRLLFISTTSRTNIGLDPSVLYRCIIPSKIAHSRLKAQSYVCSLSEFITQFRKRKDNLTSENKLVEYAFACDLIVFHRPTYSSELHEAVWELQNSNVKIVADWDDLVFSPRNIEATSSYEKMSTAAEKEALRRNLANFRQALNLFKHHFASTTTLANQIDSINGEEKSSHAVVIPNVPPPSWISVAKYKHQQRSMGQADLSTISTIGYMGGTASHNLDFKEIESEITSILKGDDQMRFFFCSVAFQSEITSRFPSQAIPFRPVPFNGLLELYSSIDCSIAPLRQHIFNLCKSGLKFFESALLGVPLFCSFNSDISERYAGSPLLGIEDSTMTARDTIYSLIDFKKSNSKKYLDSWLEAIDQIHAEQEIVASRLHSMANEE